MSAMSLAKYALLGIVGGLYGVACSLPAAYFDEGGHVCTGVRLGSPTGFEALLSGWFPPFTIPWAANLLLVGAGVLLVKDQFRVAAWIGGMASLIALVTAGYFLIGLIPQLLAGYFWWQGAITAFAAGAAGLAVWTRRSRNAAANGSQPVSVEAV